MPTRRPSQVDPRASQQSSISHRPCRSQKAVTASRSKGFPSVWATMTARVRALRAASSRATSMLYPGSVTSTKTGTRPFWTIGFTVVGKPAATVITSSPGCRRRSRSRGDVSAVSASRFAEEPEFTSRAWRWPVVSRRRRSNASVSGPAVSQKSRLVRTRSTTSSSPNTRPAQETRGAAGSKGAGRWRSRAYAATSSRMRVTRGSWDISCAYRHPARPP